MTINERTAKVMENLQQLERQQIIEENRKKETNRKIILRRKIIVGAIFINHFPIALEFTPGKTESENSIEFAPLEELISKLAENQKLIEKLEEKLGSNSHKR